MGLDFHSRHCPGISSILAESKVAIAGLGGLGSHVATALTRSGVGCLRLIDFDVVDTSNLGRQNYSAKHIGRLKTESLAEILADINPDVIVETKNVKLTADNIPTTFQGCGIIVEALDNPETKAEFVETALSSIPDTVVVCASGMAGLDSANSINSRKLSPRLYICGDEHTEARDGHGLMAPRVMVCAGHQANMVLRIILNIE